ncbi:MAG: DUF4445 domain-containing protein [Chitinivibrionales bacterium]|nr:DUF4445 domain-containing protein [Chitinivibrionales bacterium]
MPSIQFFPANITITCGPGTDLLDAARKAGVAIDAPCGGNGTCGKCRVRVRSGTVKSISVGGMPFDAPEGTVVLACRSRLGDNDAAVEIPKQHTDTGGKFAGSCEQADQAVTIGPGHVSPLVETRATRVARPEKEDGLSDWDRLCNALGDAAPEDASLEALQVLARTVRGSDGNVTVTMDDRKRMIAIASGGSGHTQYGLAIDIGTTTIAVMLVSLADGEIIGVKTDYNEQISCGLDIISRINYARREHGGDDLRNHVLNAINRCIRQLTTDHGVSPDDILCVSLAGNTTMTHLLLGLPPEHIRLSPYTPTLHRVPPMNAGETGLDINRNALVRFAPAVGSYVGGDITSGLLGTEMVSGDEQIQLFIDIGTNGELVLGNSDFLMTCACSAGPAFEGGGVSCGMRAADGAVEAVKVDPATGLCDCTTIGAVKPAGICGSGMISLLAELVRTGWLDAGGKLRRNTDCSAIRVDGRKAYYILASGAQSASDSAVELSEIDIENIMRAKAAIFSAIALLTRHIGIDIEDLARVCIAGGFGRFLDITDAITLGLLPDIPEDRFRYIGNASLTGAYLTLMSQTKRELQQREARRMTYIDLSNDPGYMDQYSAALFLPHTDAGLFPSVKKPQ